MMSERGPARLMVGGRGAAIAYNRRVREWQMTTCRHSVSRLSLATMIEEKRMDRQG